MKKLLIFIISSLALTSFVFADETTSLDLTGYYRDFDKVITDVYASNSKYQDLITLYHTTYESDYPYFVISSDANFHNSNQVEYVMYLIPGSFNSERFEVSYQHDGLVFSLLTFATSWTGVKKYTTYNTTLSDLSSNAIWYYWSVDTGYYNPIVYSNYSWQIKDNLSTYDEVAFPSFSSLSHDISFQYFELGENSVLPTYLSLYEGDYEPGISYTTINLNNYDYVALSLRDYTQTQAFSTNFIVEGQLCLTPVYDYGMTEKTGAGYKVQRCSPVYSTPSPMRVDIIENDLKNHAIYYLKAYNTSISNIIKVDSSIFNITYIDSSTSQPYINVNGVQYPSIPYSQLSSSATLSESEGYVSGEVTNVFDTSGDSEFIENLFSNPLETLQSTWGTILTMFGLIGSFINLLPEVLQAFLYTTLALALTIGIIKILT